LIISSAIPILSLPSNSISASKSLDVGNSPHSTNAILLELFAKGL